MEIRLTGCAPLAEKKAKAIGLPPAWKILGIVRASEAQMLPVIPCRVAPHCPETYSIPEVDTEKIMTHHSHDLGDRRGARQPERFNPERASRLDDPARFEYLPPREVVRMLDIPDGGIVLDFGTGTGTYAIQLATLRPDAEVIALDEQPDMLDLLRAKDEAAGLANLKPVLSGQVQDYIGKIDRVLALNVLHELGDEALRNLKGLLNPDGLALFIDWNTEVDRPAGPPADHVYSPSEGRQRLEQMGFRVEAESSFPYHYSILAH